MEVFPYPPIWVPKRLCKRLGASFSMLSFIGIHWCISFVGLLLVGLLILQPSLSVTPWTTFSRLIFNPVFNWCIRWLPWRLPIEAGVDWHTDGYFHSNGNGGPFEQEFFWAFFVLNFSMYSNGIVLYHSVILSNQHMHRNQSSFFRSIISLLLNNFSLLCFFP